MRKDDGDGPMTTRTCDNCSTAVAPDDVFCENCGYDFITGSLPVDEPDVGEVGAPPSPPAVAAVGPDSAPAGTDPDGAGPEASDPGLGQPPPMVAPSVLSPPAEGAEATSSPGAGPRVRIEVSAEQAFYDVMVADGEIDFPDPPPAAAELVLVGDELHIGRTSESRAIHPDIDIADLTGDQAVSSRHAVVRLGPGATATITDVGSTNGTFVDQVDGEPIDTGVPVAIEPGTEIYLGAWTRLTIVDLAS